MSDERDPEGDAALQLIAKQRKKIRRFVDGLAEQGIGIAMADVADLLNRPGVRMAELGIGRKRGASAGMAAGERRTGNDEG